MEDAPSFASPICIPWNENLPGYKIDLDQEATFAGWGYLSDEPESGQIPDTEKYYATDNLQFYDPQIVLSEEECWQLKINSTSQLCAIHPLGLYV